MVFADIEVLTILTGKQKLKWIETHHLYQIMKVHISSTLNTWVGCKLNTTPSNIGAAIYIFLPKCLSGIYFVTGLDDQCSAISDCAAVTDSECSSGTCQCATGYIKEGIACKIGKYNRWKTVIFKFSIRETVIYFKRVFTYGHVCDEMSQK